MSDTVIQHGIIAKLSLDTSDYTASLSKADRALTDYGAHISAVDAVLAEFNITTKKAVESLFIEAEELNVVSVAAKNAASAQVELASGTMQAAVASKEATVSNEAQAVSHRSVASAQQQVISNIRALQYLGGFALYEGVKTSVQDTLEYDQALRHLDTVLQESRPALLQWGEAAQDISRNIGTGVIDTLHGMYDAISAGVPKDNLLAVTEVAAKGAIAGMTDADSVIKLLATTVNSGMGTWADSSHLMDMYFKTIHEGVITLPEFAKNMGNILSTAREARVPLDETLAAFVALTRGGLNASNALTALNQLIREFTHATPAARKEAEHYHIELSAAHLASVGLAGALQEVTEKTNGNVEAIQRLFPNVRGYKAEAILAADGTKELSRALESVRDNSGSFEDSFNRMKGDMFALRQEAETVNQAMVDVGNSFVGMVKAVDGENNDSSLLRFKAHLDQVAVPLVFIVTETLLLIERMKSMGDAATFNLFGNVGEDQQAIEDLKKNYDNFIGTIAELKINADALDESTKRQTIHARLDAIAWADRAQEYGGMLDVYTAMGKAQEDFDKWVIQGGYSQASATKATKEHTASISDLKKAQDLEIESLKATLQLLRAKTQAEKDSANLAVAKAKGPGAEIAELKNQINDFKVLQDLADQAFNKNAFGRPMIQCILALGKFDDSIVGTERIYDDFLKSLGQQSDSMSFYNIDEGLGLLDKNLKKTTMTWKEYGKQSTDAIRSSGALLHEQLTDMHPILASFAKQYGIEIKDVMNATKGFSRIMMKETANYITDVAGMMTNAVGSAVHDLVMGTFDAKKLFRSLLADMAEMTVNYLLKMLIERIIFAKAGMAAQITIANAQIALEALVADAGAQASVFTSTPYPYSIIAAEAAGAEAYGQVTALEIGTIASADTGMYVPGYAGQPVPMIVHGKEVILNEGQAANALWNLSQTKQTAPGGSAGSSSGGGGLHVHFHGNIITKDSNELAKMLAPSIAAAVRDNSQVKTMTRRAR